MSSLPLPGDKHRSTGDRSNMEIFSRMHKEKTRKIFEEQMAPYLKKQQEVSDITIVDLMAHLVKYAGRVEVKGFGVFTIRQTQPKKIPIGNGQYRVDPGHFRLEFKQSNMLRDMINDDFFGDSEPRRNTDYFIEASNIMI